MKLYQNFCQIEEEYILESEVEFVLNIKEVLPKKFKEQDF